MKYVILALLLALASCASLPVDVFAIRSDSTIEEMKASVTRPPDKVRHYVREGKSFESWLYVKEGIFLVFCDNVLVEWRN